MVKILESPTNVMLEENNVDGQVNNAQMSDILSASSPSLASSANLALPTLVPPIVPGKAAIPSPLLSAPLKTETALDQSSNSPDQSPQYHGLQSACSLQQPPAADPDQPLTKQCPLIGELVEIMVDVKLAR